jgi:hypothetical protein
MNLLNILPRATRKSLIDSVYGSEEDRGRNIYLGAVWGLWLLAALLVAGFTPFAWPAERNGQVESLEPVLCDDIRPIDDDTPADEPASNSSRAKGKVNRAALARAAACRQALSAGDRTFLARAEQMVTYLQRGGDPPVELGVPAGTPLRAWIDSNVCRLGGADRADRGALAWHVWQGIGECGFGDRLVAQLPLTIWLGRIAGIFFTLLILGAGTFFLLRHSLRLPAVRRAYRRLYGSEHKAA